MLVWMTWTALATPPLEVRWVRDSEEYAALTTMIYAVAADAVSQQAASLKRPERWSVVLDVDETVLDNSTFQLEQIAYGRAFEPAPWNAWTERRAATPVPGVGAFLERVRAAGGDVVFLTNRHEVSRQATVDNLAAHALWRDGDLLCLASDDEANTKRARRAQLRDGAGACSLPKGGRQVLAYIGDTMHDFPETGEDGDRATNFGRRFFLLPNPMYGSWTRAVTRPELLP
jgi:5'-nucleotidase (lipoprotein e(P4) family)